MINYTLEEYLKLDKEDQEIVRLQVLKEAKQKTKSSQILKDPEFKKLLAETKLLSKGVKVDIKIKTNIYYALYDNYIGNDDGYDDEDYCKSQEYKDLNKKASLLYKETTKLAKKFNMDADELRELIESKILGL